MRLCSVVFMDLSCMIAYSTWMIMLLSVSW
jgi:hypothetical protein